MFILENLGLDLSIYLKAPEISTAKFGVDFWRQLGFILISLRSKSNHPRQTSRSIGGPIFAVALCQAFEIKFDFLSLD